MKIGTYPFAVPGDTRQNFERMEKAICAAARQNASSSISSHPDGTLEPFGNL